MPTPTPRLPWDFYYTVALTTLFTRQTAGDTVAEGRLAAEAARIADRVFSFLQPGGHRDESINEDFD